MTARLKLLALLTTTVAIGAAAAVGWYSWPSGGGDGTGKYRLAKVERGPMAAVVATTGTLNAVSAVQVGAQIPGELKEVHADFNTPVLKGQVIARIDPEPYQLRVARTQADLEAAAAAVASARIELAAARGPRERRRTGAALDAALAAAKQREALLRQAQADLERTAIRSPADGTVILRNVEAGQAVDASPRAPALFTIAEDLHEMEVEAAVEAADARRLRVGLPASFSVEAFPRRSFSGELQQIRKSPRSSKAPSYTIVLSAQNPELALLPGMAASVRIVVEERTSALKVPNAALRWRPMQDNPTGERRPHVHVLREGEPHAIAVRTGLDDGASTELLGDALAEGAEVIIGMAGQE